MQYHATRFSNDHRADALAELRAELDEFSYDGLTQLADDMRGRCVLRGSWSGCVISYKHGAPGSCRRDRLGRARNAFTVLWDNGWITDEDVAALVADELRARQRDLREAAPLTTLSRTVLQPLEACDCC